MSMNDEAGNQIQEPDSRTHVQPLYSLQIHGPVSFRLANWQLCLVYVTPVILITIIRVRYLIQEGLSGSYSGNLELRLRDSYLFYVSVKKWKGHNLRSTGWNIFPHDAGLSSRKTWRQRAEEFRGCAKMLLISENILAFIETSFGKTWV